MKTRLFILSSAAILIAQPVHADRIMGWRETVYANKAISAKTEGERTAFQHALTGINPEWRESFGWNQAASNPQPEPMYAPAYVQSPPIMTVRPVYWMPPRQIVPMEYQQIETPLETVQRVAAIYPPQPPTRTKPSPAATQTDAPPAAETQSVTVPVVVDSFDDLPDDVRGIVTRYVQEEREKTAAHMQQARDLDIMRLNDRLTLFFYGMMGLFLFGFLLVFSVRRFAQIWIQEGLKHERHFQ